jgi:uncharacterized protein YciI
MEPDLIRSLRLDSKVLLALGLAVWPAPGRVPVAAAAAPPPVADRTAAWQAGFRTPMRHYVMGILRSSEGGPTLPKTRVDNLRAGHLANIRRMFDEHRLVCAGPFVDDGPLQGLYIFDADSVAQVRPWLDAYPFLSSGHMVCELRRWLGPVGISEEYRRAAGVDPTRRDSLVHYTMALLVRGPKWQPVEDAATRELRARSVAGVEKMSEVGSVALAGPFEDDGDPGAIVVFATGDTAVARRWSDADPAVAAGRLRVELHPWLTAHGILAHGTPTAPTR